MSKYVAISTYQVESLEKKVRFRRGRKQRRSLLFLFWLQFVQNYTTCVDCYNR